MCACKYTFSVGNYSVEYTDYRVEGVEGEFHNPMQTPVSMQRLFPAFLEHVVTHDELYY